MDGVHEGYSARPLEGRYTVRGVQEELRDLRDAGGQIVVLPESVVMAAFERHMVGVRAEVRSLKETMAPAVVRDGNREALLGDFKRVMQAVSDATLGFAVTMEEAAANAERVSGEVEAAGHAAGVVEDALKAVAEAVSAMEKELHGVAQAQQDELRAGLRRLHALAGGGDGAGGGAGAGVGYRVRVVDAAVMGCGLAKVTRFV